MSNEETLRRALEYLIAASAVMPHKTPSAGGSSTMHEFKIAAHLIWGLDQALKYAHEALAATQEPAHFDGEAALAEFEK